MKPPKWKVKRISQGWLAHKATCPAADHFCWRGLFSWAPGCRIFDQHGAALQHAHTSAREDQAMSYMDNLPSLVTIKT